MHHLHISVLANSRLSALARACNIARQHHNLIINASVFSTLPLPQLALEKNYIKSFRSLPPKPQKDEYDQIAEDADFKSSRFCMLFYTRLVPEKIYLSRPTVNFHPSLLPDYPGLRGFEEAIRSHQLAITAHKVDSSIDGGTILFQYQVHPFPANRTIVELNKDISNLCSAAIVELIVRNIAGKIQSPHHRVFASGEDALVFASSAFKE